MKSYLIEFSTIISLFFVIDAIVDQKAKTRISEYIFGFHKISIGNFEARLVAALLSPFLIDGRVSWKRVIPYSIISWHFTFAIFLVTGDAYLNPNPKNSTNILSHLLGAFFRDIEEAFSTGRGLYILSSGLVILVIIPAFSSPVDYIFMRLGTRFIHFGESKKALGVRLFLLAIGILSLAPSALSIGFMYFFFGVGDNPTDTLPGLLLGSLMFSVAMQFGSGFLFGAVVFLIISTSVILRFLIIITGLNKYLILISDIHKYPFTFIGFFVSTFIIIAA